MKIDKKKKGFTIIEMLIVIAISGILMGTIGFSIITFNRNFGEKTARSETSMYLEQVLEKIQLEFPGASTVPHVDDTTLNFTPLPEYDDTFNAARFGTVKHVFVGKYDDVFDVSSSDYDTYKYLFVSHWNTSANDYTFDSNFGIKEINIQTLGVRKMKYLSVGKPPQARIEEVTIGNMDGKWYLIQFKFIIRNYWYKDKAIEDASGKKDPYNFDFTLNTNIKIRN